MHVDVEWPNMQGYTSKACITEWDHGGSKAMQLVSNQGATGGFLELGTPHKLRGGGILLVGCASGVLVVVCLCGRALMAGCHCSALFTAGLCIPFFLARLSCLS